jgi:lantibiotic modifying enzyme
MERHLKILDEYIANYQCKDNKIGIVTGESGLVLLLAQLYCYTNNEKYCGQMNLLLDRITEKNDVDYSLGYGWCGFAWILLQIKKLNIKEDIDEWLNDLDAVLEKEFYLMLNSSNLDYFEGASGVLFYFMEKGAVTPNICEMANAYISHISNKIKTSRWEEDIFNPETRQMCKVINLGVPHGITGLLLMLLIIHKNKTADCQNTIKQLIDVLLSFEIKDANIGCRFASRIINGIKNPNDVAWCYGDLMIGYGILKAGFLLNNNDYMSYGEILLTETLKRKNHHDDHLILCHGYTSLSHVYNCVYQLTGEKCFRQQAEKWQQASILSFENSYHKNMNLVKYNYFKQDASLFFGFSGFFMSLLDWEYNANNQWKNCLLI